jgi:hypothetical protein
MSKPSAQEIIEAAGISRTHAYDILAERQKPSNGVAAKIYVKTGLKRGLFAQLSDADAQVAARIHGEQ